MEMMVLGLKGCGIECEGTIIGMYLVRVYVL